MGAKKPRWTPLILFGAASLIAVLVGCCTAQAAGVPGSVWTRMIGAWLAGLVLALALSRGALKATPRASIAIIAIIVLLGLVWTDSGLHGVHRWIVIGPFRLNVAALLLPLAVVLLAEIAWAPLAMLVITVLLTAQPDASQASGIAVAAIVLLGAGDWRRVARWLIPVIALVAAGSWLQPDPLESVAEVEGIVGLAWAQAPVLAIVAVVALVIAALVPLAARHERGVTPAATALAAYMLVTAAMPLIGAFPVPLIGMSVSPIIGWWLGIGALAGRSPRTDQ